jgi:hypothetical protein
MEKIFNKLVPTVLVLFMSLTIIIVIIDKYFHYNSLLKKLVFILYPISIFTLSLNLILGVLNNWKSYKKGFERIDFEDIFGTTIGKIIYLVFGIILCILSIFLLLTTCNLI